MRIAIIGIGGVGGYFGGKLARAFGQSGKHEVIFIARGEHLEAIRKNGLQLFTREGDYIARPTLATDSSAEAGIFDLVFFGVKSYSLEKAAEDFSANITGKTVVIPLLNGVNIAERLRLILPDANIVSGSVYISAALEKPGTVRQTDGACKLIFGTDDPATAKKYQNILDVLLQAKINAELTDKISIALWTKYIMIGPLAGLTAATGKTFGALMENPDLRDKLRQMINEVKMIADAKKVGLPDDIVEQTLAKISRFAYDTKTSMQVDIERGNLIEIDIFTAYIKQTGLEMEIPTPVNSDIYNMISGD